MIFVIQYSGGISESLGGVPPLNIILIF